MPVVVTGWDTVEVIRPPVEVTPAHREVRRDMLALMFGTGEVARDVVSLRDEIRRDEFEDVDALADVVSRALTTAGELSGLVAEMRELLAGGR